MRFEIINSGTAAAATNMELDKKFLEEIGPEPICKLHFYEWESPSATYGYFNHSYQLLEPKALAKHRLKLAKRPTGGGLIFHQYDFAFSLILSASHPRYSANTLDSYRQINAVVAKAISKGLHLENTPELLDEELPAGAWASPQPWQFCMAKPTVYDLILEGKKVAGAAQRRTRQGLLHQGSISLQLPLPLFLEEILEGHPEIAAAMYAHTKALIGSAHDASALLAGKQALQKSLSEAFKAWSKG